MLALSIESVILERMGLTTGNATRQLARLSFKDHDIPKILEETQSGARIFLDAIRRTLKQQSFGGILKFFDKNDPNWNREAWLLQSMLTDKEYNAARASTLNAHYTSGDIVQGIYNGLENLGFNGRTILDPLMGVGGFFGNMPDEMKNYT